MNWGTIASPTKGTIVADFDALTYHHVIGRYNGIVADATGPFGDPGATPDIYTVNMAATFDLAVARAGKLVKGPPELRLTTATPPRTLLLIPIKAQVESGVLRLPGAGSAVDGIDLVAKSDILGLGPDEDLIATVTFASTTIGGSSYTFEMLRYVVPEVDPADYHAGAVQVISLTGTPDGGTWWLIYGTQPTIVMAPTATGTNVQTALRAVAAIGTAVDVVGPAGGPWTATFDTDVIPRPLPLGFADNLTGTGLPGVSVVDPYIPPTIDLTTVERWVPTP